jgi:ATP-dependent Clp protease protease subunit
MNLIPKAKSRTLILGEDVSQESVSDLIKNIYELNLEDEEKEAMLVEYERQPIHLILNTYGGSVYDGLALIGAIELSITPVVVTCLGSAMSMGLFILASGHHRRAHHLSTIMYHQISTGVWDKLEGLRKDLAEADRLEETCESILYLRTKLKRKDIDAHKKTKSEWYMTAEEALRLGIIDEIIGAPLISSGIAKKAAKQAQKLVKEKLEETVAEPVTETTPEKKPRRKKVTE